jgi:hypothetical protein
MRLVDCVQVLRRRQDENLRALSSPALQKRQGTKSREVGYGWAVSAMEN